jgi:hypothetical protein
MASDGWGVLRTVGLVVMIVFACLAEAIFIWRQQWWWASMWGSSIILGTIIHEIASYLTGKVTISTRYKEWIKKEPVQAYLTLAFMLIACLGLIVHLAVFGGMFG